MYRKILFLGNIVCSATANLFFFLFFKSGVALDVAVLFS